MPARELTHTFLYATGCSRRSERRCRVGLTMSPDPTRAEHDAQLFPTGFARRYFYLTNSPATLSYSFSPQSRIRDSVYISLASISISRRSKSIHIDSGGSLVMHIKTLSDSDFTRWTDALKSLVSQGSLKENERRQRRRKAAKKKEPVGSPSVGLGLNLAALNALRPLDMSTIYHSISRMKTVSPNSCPSSTSC